MIYFLWNRFALCGKANIHGRNEKRLTFTQQAPNKAHYNIPEMQPLRLQELNERICDIYCSQKEVKFSLKTANGKR